MNQIYNWVLRKSKYIWYAPVYNSQPWMTTTYVSGNKQWCFESIDRNVCDSDSYLRTYPIWRCTLVLYVVNWKKRAMPLHKNEKAGSACARITVVKSFIVWLRENMKKWACQWTALLLQKPTVNCPATCTRKKEPPFLLFFFWCCPFDHSPDWGVSLLSATSIPSSGISKSQVATSTTTRTLLRASQERAMAQQQQTPWGWWYPGWHPHDDSCKDSRCPRRIPAGSGALWLPKHDGPITWWLKNWNAVWKSVAWNLWHTKCREFFNYLLFNTVIFVVLCKILSDSFHQWLFRPASNLFPSFQWISFSAGLIETQAQPKV